MRVGAFDQVEKAGLLEKLNEDSKIIMRQRCRMCGGLAIGRMAHLLAYF
jgi:hypothetical protein